MADGTTIKEYLVGLGFKVDEGSYKKFNDAIGGAFPKIAMFGAEIAAVTATVEGMIEIVAIRMQDLYYAAQRTGDSAQFLTSVSNAAKMIGLNASTGAELLEGMSRAMRERPGISTILSQLTGPGGLKEVDGQMTVTQKGLDQVLDNLSKMPFWLANIYAGIIGLPTGDVLYQLLKNHEQLSAAMKQSTALAQDFGVNMDDAAAKGRNFSRAVGLVTQEIEYLAIRAFGDLEPAMKKVVDLVGDGIEEFGEWSNSMNGIPNDILAIATAVGGLTASLALLGNWFAPAGALARGIIYITGLLTKLVTLPAGIGTFIWEMWPKPANPNEQEDLKRALSGEAPRPVTPPNAWQRMWERAKNWWAGGKGASADEEKNAHNTIVQYFMQHGWTKEQSEGIAENVHAESGQGQAYVRPNAVGDSGLAYGIGQWHPERQAEFYLWAGHDIRTSTLQEQLAFIQHELDTNRAYGAGLLKQAQTAKTAAEIFSEYFERPKGGYTEAERRGIAAANVTIQQKTDIHVHGSSNPTQTAKDVAKLQTGVNNSLAQNFSGGVR